MKLLIHDLTPLEWEAVSARYAGWDVIGPSDQIRPCTGCFGCWVKTPGKCVLRDGYESLAARLSAADELLILSRCTFGGFSSFVKNVFDRSIGAVLPFFEIVDGEMHHCRRCPGAKPVTVRFRGAEISKEEQALARRYVAAVCRNLRGRVHEVSFSSCAPEPPAEIAPAQPVRGTILLNCSPRAGSSNTGLLFDRLFDALGGEAERLDLASFRNEPDALIARLRGAENIVFGMPLYVDGVPSNALRLLERLAREPAPGGQRVYVVANNGLYESRQLQNLLGTVRLWSARAGFTYGGGAAIGAGELLRNMPHLLPAGKGPARPAVDALKTLADAVSRGGTIPDRYADPKGFPRAAYVIAANLSWPKGAKANGLRTKDLFARP